MPKPFRRARPRPNPLFFQNRTLSASSGSADLSTLATKVSLGNLATRVSSLETLGISGISNAVSWTNLSEINLSGEKLVDGDFSNTTAEDDTFTFPTSVGYTNYSTPYPVIKILNSWHSDLTTGNQYDLRTVQIGNEQELTDMVLKDTDAGGDKWVGLGAGRGIDWEIAGLSLDNWTVTSGTLDETKLASGIVDGTGGAVAITQNFSQTIPSGTELIFKATRADTQTGNVRFNPIRASDGVVMSVNIGIDPSVGYASYTTTVEISGVKLDTLHGLREVSSVSVFQGAVSGGTVQAYAGGGLEKISGASGYNSGGFSVNYIPGNADGYFQFQLAQNNKALRVGLVYADADYSTVSPFGLDFNATGNIDNMNPYQDNITTYAQGDWFRVRHYASSNQVHFQKRQTVYVDDTDFCLLQTCGLQPNNGHANDHTFATVDRPLIIAKETVNGLTTGEYYRIHAVNTSSGNTRIYTLDGVQIGWMTGRGTNWEVQKESGQDYFTFLTCSTTTNGNDLYLDVAFDSVGGRINDVTIVT